MAENLIFEQHLEAFEPSADFPGLYGQFVPSSLFELAIGETYRIVWDGEEFLVEARDASQILDGWIYVGNGTPYGMAGNNEPFVIGVSPDGIYFFSYDEGSDHIIAIYHIVEEAVQRIIVRDRDGIPHEYEGIETVTFDTTNGGKQVFSKGQAIEGVEVELDFSDGDHPIYAPDGTLVKSAIIKKPVDLVPENIAQGITIAGIEGILAASSGDSNVKISIVKHNFGIASKTYSHDLGVIPDLIISVPTTEITNSTAGTRRLMIFGVSSAFYEAYPDISRMCMVSYASSKWSVFQYDIPFDQSTSGPLYNVTDTQFSTTSELLNCTFILISGLI